MEQLLAHKAEILGFLFAASELLGLNPKIQANGVFQMFFGIIKKMMGK